MVMKNSWILRYIWIFYWPCFWFRFLSQLWSSVMFVCFLLWGFIKIRAQWLIIDWPTLASVEANNRPCWKINELASFVVAHLLQALIALHWCISTYFLLCTDVYRTAEERERQVWLGIIHQFQTLLSWGAWQARSLTNTLFKAWG